MRVARVTGFASGFAVAIGLFVGFVGYMAWAQSPRPDNSPAALLVGATVFSAEAAPIGAVTAVSVADDGLITEIRVTLAMRLGFGERTLPISQGHFAPFAGGVILDLSVAEIEALPLPAILRNTAV